MAPVTNTSDIRSTTRSASARRFVLGALGAGSVLLTLGPATAPAASASVGTVKFFNNAKGYCGC